MAYSSYKYIYNIYEPNLSLIANNPKYRQAIKSIATNC